MNVTTVVILGTLAMLVLAITIVAFVFVYQKKLIQRDLKIQKLKAEYQKELLKATIQAQEKERKRISQDLHDDIGAMLSTIRLSINAMIKGLPLTEKHLGKAQNTKSLIDETVRNVRRISHDLLPATLEEFGLSHALEQLFKKIEINTNLEVEYQLDHDLPKLDKAKELALYRIIQELCNNIIKHANASCIEAWLTRNNDNLEITLMDDGNGFYERTNDSKSSHGLGLKNIESRLSMIDAEISYEPAPLKGTKVQIKTGYQNAIF